MTRFQRILVAVSGWPDNATRDITRLVLVQDCTIAKCVTTAIANRLGGIHTIAMRVMDDDEPEPTRDNAERDRGQEILRYVTNRVH